MGTVPKVEDDRGTPFHCIVVGVINQGMTGKVSEGVVSGVSAWKWLYKEGMEKEPELDLYLYFLSVS